MTVKDLMSICSQIPSDAEVYIECDHGQNKEQACSVTMSRTSKDNAYFGDPDAMVWEWDNYEEWYDEWALEGYDPKAPVTAVLIAY